MASPIEAVQAEKAASALLAFVEKSKGKEHSLLNETDRIWLTVGLKKVPQSSVKPKRVPLVHTLYPAGESEVCLFTKDTKADVEKLLEEKEVEGITKVICIDKLKKKYKTHEAKRQLSAAFDLFLCDERIYHILPRHLGKKFFEKKKRPQPVNLGYKNLKEEFAKARNSTYLYLGQGPCSAVPIAHSGMEVDAIVRNVIQFTEVLGRIVPRGWSNIQSVHLKTSDSVSLPLHVSLPRAPTKLPSANEPPKKRRKTLPPSRPVRT